MRLCFLVNIRNASGRKVAGGRRMGRMVGMRGCGTLLRTGWTGVPKAGEDEGSTFAAGAVANLPGLKNAATGPFSEFVWLSMALHVTATQRLC